MIIFQIVSLVRPWISLDFSFAAMIGVLVFANWGKPLEMTGTWGSIYAAKWPITSGFAAAFGLMLIFWFKMQARKVALMALPVIVLAFLLPDQPLNFQVDI